MQFVTTWSMLRDAGDHVWLSQILKCASSALETVDEGKVESKMTSVRADGESS